MTHLKQFLSLTFIYIFACFYTLPIFANSAFENQVIEKIEVVIMNLPETANFDNQSVRARITTKEGNLFSQTDFDADLKTLAQDFDRVDPVLESIDGKMHITLKIWPKPTIRTITWRGNVKEKTSRLQKELAIGLCTIFDRQNFNKAFHKLKAYYIKSGFFEAELEYDVNLDCETNEVDVIITINEGRAGRIKQIKFRGFTNDEESDLVDMIMTKEYSFFMSWLTGEGTYHEEAIQQDQFVIINYLQNEGYADARVKIDIKESRQSNRIIIIIEAEKGPVYSFGRVTFHGNKLFCDEEIDACFRFWEGYLYCPDRIRQTVKAITDLYGKKGYIDAVVNFEPKLYCEHLAYDIDFTIEEGEKYHVGLIKVFGNCSTQTNVILHETFLVPGEVFNIEKLQKTEERLQNTGFFKNVNVYAVKSDGPLGLGDCYRDVHIEVEETNTGNFSAFFGFSTVESIFGGISITENNFNYRGFSRLWRDGYSALRGGGEYLSISATLGNKSRSYLLSWTKPYFMDTQWSVGFDLERSSNHYISKDYDIEATGFTLHAGYSINSFLKAGWHYRIKNTYTHVYRHASHLLKDEARLAGLISATGLSLIYDSTDHPQKPSRGFKSRVDGEYAGVGGDHHFFGIGYLNSYYIPIDKKSVIKLRGDLRFIKPMDHNLEKKLHREDPSAKIYSVDTLPLDERLFLGGDNSVRGYRPYKLGPHFSHGDPRGGVSMQIYSIEYTRNLLKRLDGFLFFDAGHLSAREWNFGRLSTSVGYGIRFKIFESGPPLTVGMGYPLNPRSNSEVKNFFLTVGGRF
jgi:outer membrane protein insertion porin family